MGALLLAGCGGGGDATEPPPPPPPPLTPASVAVNAGDGQIAEPGQSLATQPSVIVRSANGTAVPNVSVTFVVDSGGGSIASTSASTNASGIATAGSWTLGSAEGPQVLVATVASLPPVKVRAVARIATVVVNSNPITTTGGTITISRPGQPLDGLTLSIAAGAVTAATPITLSVASTAGVQLGQGQVAVSPALKINGGAGLLKHRAMVRFPAATPPDENTFLAMYNPATGASLVVPQQVRELTGITAYLDALDGSIIPRPPAASNGLALPLQRLSASVAADEEEVLLMLVRIPPEALTRSYESGFEAMRDNWDFPNTAVAWLPILAGAQEGDPSTEVIDISSGMIATTLWHFMTQQGGPPLFKRFRLQPDQPKSNRAGLRWTALATAGAAPHVAAVIEDLKALLFPGGENLPDPFSEGDPARFQWHQLVLLKSQFYNNWNRPQPVLLFDVPNPHAVPEEQQLDPWIGIATRIVGDQVFVIHTEDEGFAFPITITRDGGLQPTTIIGPDGEAFVVKSIMPVAERPFIDTPAVAANWAKVLNGTVGDSDGWPTVELRWAKDKLDTAKVFVGDTLTHWWECSQCPDFGVQVPSAPPNATKPQAFQYGHIVGGVMAALPDHLVLPKTRWRPDSVVSDVAETITGHHILLAQHEIEPGKVAGGWLDWQTVKYRKVSLHPNPAMLEFQQDTTVNVSLAPSQALPAGTTYSWILATQSTRDSVTSVNGAHARDLKSGDDGYLVILAHEAGQHKRIIARDSIRIQHVTPVPFWKLKTFVDVDDLVDPPGEDPDQGGPLFELLWGAESVPGSALIAISGNQLSMRVKRAGVWNDCCPPPFGGDDHVFAFPTWTQSDPDLGTGTVTGVQTEGLSEFSITATRNGKIMTGTMTLKVSVMDEGQLDTSTYVFTFTAERMR